MALALLLLGVLPATAAGGAEAQGDTTPPDPPAYVRIERPSVFGDVELALSWTYGTDNVAVTGYLIHRNGEYVGYVRATPGAETHSTTDLPSEHGYFEVRSQDAAGNISRPRGVRVLSDPLFSDPPMRIDQPPLPAAQNAQDVEIRWLASPTGPVGYDIERNGSHVARVGPTSRSYVDRAVIPGTYRYDVIASGPGGPLDHVTIYRNFGMPPSLSGPGPLRNTSGSANGRQVTLRWDAAPPGGAVIDRYLIRDTVGQVAVVEGDTTSVTLPDVPLGRTQYRVIAVDAWAKLAFGEWTAVTVGSSDGVPPEPPVSMTFYEIDDTPYVSWPARIDPEGVRGYLLHVDGQYRAFMGGPRAILSRFVSPTLVVRFLEFGEDADRSWHQLELRTQDVFGLYSAPLVRWCFGPCSEGSFVGPFARTATVDSSGGAAPLLQWEAAPASFGPQKGVVIHRNGDFIAFVKHGVTSWTDATASDARHAYQIRYQRADGTFGPPGPVLDVST